jgi:hypothetical protein
MHYCIHIFVSPSVTSSVHPIANLKKDVSNHLIFNFDGTSRQVHFRWVQPAVIHPGR